VDDPSERKERGVAYHGKSSPRAEGRERARSLGRGGGADGWANEGMNSLAGGRKGPPGSGSRSAGS
jgi:hypothetical protein